MKKIIPICLFFFAININSQIINFPDDNFKTALLNHNPTIDINSDGEIQESEASSFTGTLDVSEKTITDITGIEYFTEITIFHCQDNSIASIDMSSNLLLEEINADHNLLGYFSISNNTHLENLYCSYNNTLTEIDVSQNLELKILECIFNQLNSTLDCSNNSLLERILCNDNDLIIINIANGNNDVISFNLDNNPNLEFVYVDDPDSIFASFLSFILGNTVQVTSDPNASLESNTLNKYISVYPNPTSDLVNIKTDKNINSFEIFDINGNIVMSKNTTHINQISLNSLAKGVYFCKIKDDLGLTGIVKVIKQ